jgi:hypothetical protein
MVMNHTQHCIIDPFSPGFESAPAVIDLCETAVKKWGQVGDIADDERKKELLSRYGHGEGQVFNLVRWVILVYDPKSPLQKDFPDLLKRKRCALEEIGLDPDSDWEWLFKNTDPGVVGIIASYLRNYCKSRLWAMIVANNETFWEFFTTMIQRNQEGAEDMTGVNAKIRTSDGMISLLDRIDKQMNEFYSSEERGSLSEGDEIFMSVEKMAHVLSGRRG